MNLTTSGLLRDAAAFWTSWMSEMAWQVAILVVALAAISFALRRRSASLRYALWLLVLVRLVLPPSLASPTGWSWWFRPPSVTTQHLATPTVAPTNNQGEIKSPSPSSAPAAAPGGIETFSLSVLLMMGWLGIVAARFGMLLTAGLQVRVWVLRARPITDPKLLGLLRDSRQRVGIRRSVDLRNSESCATPLVVGVWRPVILLPSTVLERLDANQLRSVLIHELQHVRRWDGAVNLVQGILGAVYFFHPLVWLANRQIRQLREEVCDERTVATLQGHRKPYGEAIFKVAEILGYAAPPLALGVLDSKTPLKQRLARILDPTRTTDEPPHWPSSLLTVFAVGVILIPNGARPIPRDQVSWRTRPPGAVAEESDEITPEPQTPDGPRETIEPESEVAVRDDQIPAADDWARRLSDPRERATAIDTLISIGPAAEPMILGGLQNSDRATRSAIYRILEKIGTQASVMPLQTAMLERGAVEQAEAKQAIDAIYERIVGSSGESGSEVNAMRIFK